VAVTSPDGLAAAFTVADGDGGGRRLVALAGGTDRWVTDGRPTESGPRGITGAPPDVYVRPYVGTAVDPAAMQAYLDWEHGLPAQLEADGTHRFTVWDGAALRPGHPAAR
jgi:hypothetical protein